MFQSDYRREMDRLAPSPAALERLEGLLAEGTAAKRPRRRLGRRAVAVLVLCGALTATALAAGPTVRQALEAHLGAFAPYLSGGGARSVRSGVALEVVGAVSNGASARVYLTARDRRGGRLDGRTAVSLELEGANSWGVNTLAFDKASDTLLLELEAEGLNDGGRLAVTGGTFTPSQYAVAVYPDLDAVPEGALADAETGWGGRVLLPGQGQTFDGLDGFSTVLGFDSAGQFHLRTVLAEGYGMTASSCIFAFFADGSTRATEAEDVAHLEDGQDILVEGITPENWEQVEKLWLITSYGGPLEPVEGDWRLTLDTAAAAGASTPEGFSLALPGGGAVTSVSLSPLGVVAAYTGAADSLPEDALCVTLAGGGPPAWGDISAWNWGGDGYVVWNFARPVELDDIASVTIRGETIPLP